MTIAEAKNWISYAIKEGIYEAEDFEGLSDQELIAFATLEQDRSDRAIYSAMEEENEQSN